MAPLLGLSKPFWINSTQTSAWSCPLSQASEVFPDPAAKFYSPYMKISLKMLGEGMFGRWTPAMAQQGHQRHIPVSFQLRVSQHTPGTSHPGSAQAWQEGVKLPEKG